MSQIVPHITYEVITIKQLIVLMRLINIYGVLSQYSPG